MDPFVFLDESLNPAGVAGLGGGGHPHAGLTAITYLSPDRKDHGMGPSQGGTLSPWDNLNGDSDCNTAGSVYVISAGRGVVHDERNVTPEGFVMHQFQLWVDPGIAKFEQDGSSPHAHATLHSSAQIPVAKGVDLGPDTCSSVSITEADENPSPADSSDSSTNTPSCRVMIGEQFGKISPVPSPVPGGMLYLHLRLPSAGSRVDVTVPGGFRGLVYVVQGRATVGGTMLSHRQCGILAPCDSTAHVSIGNAHGSGSDGAAAAGITEVKDGPTDDQHEEEEMQLLFVAGQPQCNGPLFKFLGNGGAVFSSTEAGARELMAEFEMDRERFGSDRQATIKDNQRQPCNAGRLL